MILCKKCGNPCRIGTEPVGRDNNGLPVFHRFSYCDRCRLKEDLDLVQNSPKQKSKKRKDSLFFQTAAKNHLCCDIRQRPSSGF